MKKLILIIMGTFLILPTFSFASSEHSHSMPKIDKMSDDMTVKMDKMKADMIAIKKEKNSDKRKEMMKAHMKDMKNMMKMKHTKHVNKMKDLENRIIMLEIMMEQVIETHITALDPDDPIYDED